MKMTSAEAGKLLKSMQDELNNLLFMEAQSKDFESSVGEDLESNRPEYDFAACQKELAEKEEKIRLLKHAINKFNVSTKVPGFDMTIDQMLIYIPQLSAKKSKLEMMRSRLPKSRAPYNGSNIITYEYANYDIKEAEAEYQRVSALLTKAQLALDNVNSSKLINIEL